MGESFGGHPSLTGGTMNELRTLLEKWAKAEEGMMVCWPGEGGTFVVRTGRDTTAVIWPEMLTASTTRALDEALESAAACSVFAELYDEIVEATNTIDLKARLRLYLVLSEWQDREEYDAAVSEHGHTNGYGQA
jgi:hypothetical protein